MSVAPARATVVMPASSPAIEPRTRTSRAGGTSRNPFIDAPLLATATTVASAKRAIDGAGEDSPRSCDCLSRISAWSARATELALKASSALRDEVSQPLRLEHDGLARGRREPPRAATPPSCTGTSAIAEPSVSARAPRSSFQRATSGEWRRRATRGFSQVRGVEPVARFEALVREARRAHPVEPEGPRGVDGEIPGVDAPDRELALDRVRLDAPERRALVAVLQVLDLDDDALLRALDSAPSRASPRRTHRAAPVFRRARSDRRSPRASCARA